MIWDGRRGVDGVRVQSCKTLMEVTITVAIVAAKVASAMRRSMLMRGLRVRQPR
jgi:hypothetical protein